MKYSEDIKLEIGGKFINGDYHKNLKLLTKDLDKLIKSAKNEQLLIHSVSSNEVKLKFNEFANKQQDLDSEFVKIVNDNFWDLL